MYPCVDGPGTVEIITAVGAVLSSLVTIYLVHRRILADRDTKWHRDDESRIHQAVLKKLGAEIEDLEREKAEHALTHKEDQV